MLYNPAIPIGVHVRLQPVSGTQISGKGDRITTVACHSRCTLHSEIPMSYAEMPARFMTCMIISNY